MDRSLAVIPKVVCQQGVPELYKYGGSAVKREIHSHFEQRY